MQHEYHPIKKEATLPSKTCIIS